MTDQYSNLALIIDSLELENLKLKQAPLPSETFSDSDEIKKKYIKREKRLLRKIEEQDDQIEKLKLQIRSLEKDIKTDTSNFEKIEVPKNSDKVTVIDKPKPKPKPEKLAYRKQVIFKDETLKKIAEENLYKNSALKKTLKINGWTKGMDIFKPEGEESKEVCIYYSDSRDARTAIQIQMSIFTQANYNKRLVNIKRVKWTGEDSPIVVY